MDTQVLKSGGIVGGEHDCFYRSPQHLIDRMNDRNITLAVTPPARVMLAERGYDPDFGARPLKRLIQRVIVDPAAMLILEGRAKEHDMVTVDVVDGELQVGVSPVPIV